MFYDHIPYYPRGRHISYGDFIFGRVITYLGRRWIVAGMTRSYGKRPSYRVLLVDPERKTLVSSQLTQAIKADGPPEFCTSEESESVMTMLRVAGESDAIVDEQLGDASVQMQ